jgi:glycosyltransferase involved in cell wall biosynthesis
LRRWIAGNIGRFDIVLLHDVYSAVSVISARAAARAGVPFALQPLGTLSAARERGRPVVKRVFLTLWGRRTVRSAAALLYLAEHEAQDFLAAGAPRDRLLHMPLPLELPSPTGAHTSERPTVAFVGRLHPIKCVDRLIEAIAIAREEVPDVRLEIVGPGDRHRQTLARQAARLGLDNTVVFHGYVDPSEKLRILRRAHVSALLSRSEGLPMAVLEAMACGIPVVLSHGCHLDEVQARAGFVVPDSAQDAATALVRLLRDSDLRSRLGEGAAAFADRFRCELVMPEMVGALERIAAGGGGHG